MQHTALTAAKDLASGQLLLEERPSHLHLQGHVPACGARRHETGEPPADNNFHLEVPYFHVVSRIATPVSLMLPACAVFCPQSHFAEARRPSTRAWTPFPLRRRPDSLAAAFTCQNHEAGQLIPHTD